ncbi:unnamed protein product [Lasius platythorax]|uniref:Uncharacterized protein n=1 Tax=Lasius platythorax TaxID=488582 RepID=A0AAV2P0E9_9HYME
MQHPASRATHANPRPTKKTHTIAITHVPIPLVEASLPMEYHTINRPRSLSGLYRVSMNLRTIEYNPAYLKETKNCIVFRLIIIQLLK